MPRGKIYIVNLPSLISAIGRRARTISFAPYVVQFAKRILASSPQALSDLEADLLEKNSPVGLRPETLKVMHDSLAPGGPLENTTQVMLEGVMSVLKTIRNCDEREINLFDWTRRLVTKASTDAIYGAEENPFQDEVVYHGLWTIDKNFVLLGLNILPHLVTRRGSQARNSFFYAMRKYYYKGGHKHGSPLIQERYEVSLKYGLAHTDIEHFNLSVSYGLLVNTVPATAWVLYHVYSNPSLLKRIRHEIELLVSQGRRGIVEINVPDVIRSCPLLESLTQLEEIFLAYESASLPLKQPSLKTEFTADPGQLQDVSNPLAWWISQRATFPTVSQLALHILAIPAMSADCERAFSLEKLTLTSQRLSMSSETLEHVQCLENWLRRGSISLGGLNYHSTSIKNNQETYQVFRECWMAVRGP